jgi:hypothetical protein
MSPNEKGIIIDLKYRAIRRMENICPVRYRSKIKELKEEIISINK